MRRRRRSQESSCDAAYDRDRKCRGREGGKEEDEAEREIENQRNSEGGYSDEMKTRGRNEGIKEENKNAKQEWRTKKKRCIDVLVRSDLINALNDE